jgi:hypothetical protein
LAQLPYKIHRDFPPKILLFSPSRFTKISMLSPQASSFAYPNPRLAMSTRGRCYDDNFLRFLTIFGEKIGVFHKNLCYDQNFA